ncbi:MAG: DUF1302 domain-containing protein [Opitutae bacterium]|nr:DUF1302 domain-containing protein [Opitutae bacterium]
MNPSKPYANSLRWSAFAALFAALALAPASRAFVFELGDVKGSFDTTVSVGGLFRISNPSTDLYGLTNSINGVPGKQRSVNADDGNLNYHRGLVSSLVKANHDLQLTYKNAGIFVRGFYFTDFTNNNGQRVKTALTNEAKSIVAEGGELLDAYAYFKPTLGDMPARIAIGRQVLSWGESTFIPNGINSINPIDVAKLRTPGSELKEALRPLNMISASLSVTEDIALEAFYLLDWNRTRVDPPGTYFSTNDFVAKGGTKVYLGFGAINDGAVLGAISRGTDREPGTSGQYGINLKWLAKGLGDTEFGFYWMNYHSRLPVISAQTPTSPVSVALVQATATSLGTANLAPVLTPIFGAGTPAALTTLLGAALTNVPIAALPANLQPFYPTAQSIAAGARTVGFLSAAASGRYLIEFPEDIRLFGASFNTSVKGIALQGEISYRDNQPFQVDDVELLFSALSSLNPAFANNQLGSNVGQLNTYVRGWNRHKVWTGQMTATRVGGGILGADQSTLLAEAGFVNVTDLPSKGRLRYDGPGTFVAGDATEMLLTGSNTATSPAPLSDPASAFADKFSWGYQLVGRLDYNNAFKGVNMSPLFVFSHDVSGNTPLPMGNFLHGRKSVTLGADFSYQNAWAFEVRYVNFFGGDRFNLLADRDYVSATLKYSF